MPGITYHKLLEGKSEETYILIVKTIGNMLQYIDNQTFDICVAAINQNAEALKYVKNQTREICDIAIKKNIFSMKYIRDPNICLEYVKQNPNNFDFVSKYAQTKEMCMEAVERNGLKLCYVKNQTHDICVKALQQNYISLAYIKKQTPELCLEAVKINGLALYLVEQQTREICLAAVKQNGGAIKYIDDEFYTDVELYVTGINNSNFSIKKNFKEEKIELSDISRLNYVPENIRDECSKYMNLKYLNTKSARK